MNVTSTTTRFESPSFERIQHSSPVPIARVTPRSFRVFHRQVSKRIKSLASRIFKRGNFVREKKEEWKGKIKIRSSIFLNRDNGRLLTRNKRNRRVKSNRISRTSTIHLRLNDIGRDRSAGTKENSPLFLEIDSAVNVSRREPFPSNKFPRETRNNRGQIYLVNCQYAEFDKEKSTYNTLESA